MERRGESFGNFWYFCTLLSFDHDLLRWWNIFEKLNRIQIAVFHTAVVYCRWVMYSFSSINFFRIIYDISDFTAICSLLRRNQLNLLIYGPDSFKKRSMGKIIFFLSILRVNILERKRRKTSNCFSTVYLFPL